MSEETMETSARYFNLLDDGNILERQATDILTPSTRIEEQFLLSWIQNELRDDLGYVNEDFEQLIRFHRTCSSIEYESDGRFVLPADSLDDGVPINFYIRQYFDIELNEGNRSQHFEYDFDLLWEKRGVTQPLSETSVILELIGAE
jgi:hypothetical protein